MQSDQISVLLMDDEPMSPIIQATVQILRDEGFHADLVESIAQAVEAYYETFYDVFVLDIDMNDAEDDGVRVLKRFVSLHNQTRVIMFSGAGTIHDWFEAANAHCFAYVAKDENEAIDLLISHIRSAAQARGRIRSGMRKAVCPQHLLCYSGNDHFKETADAAIANALGDAWMVTESASLEQTEAALKNASAYGAVLVLQDVFTTDASVQAHLEKILSRGPKPQVIVGCLGEDQHRPSILGIANQHPFRMIDLALPDWGVRLEAALRDAQTWYGKTEIFKADMEALERVRITLPEEALEHWKDFAPEDEQDAWEDEDESGIERGDTP